MKPCFQTPISLYGCAAPPVVVKWQLALENDGEASRRMIDSIQSLLLIDDD